MEYRNEYNVGSSGMVAGMIIMVIMLLLFIVAMVGVIRCSYKRRELLRYAKCCTCVLKIRELKGLPQTLDIENYLCETCRK